MSPVLRPSRVLSKLRSGQTVGCTKLNLADPRVADIAARAGIDCVWLDMEHVPNDLTTIENQLRAIHAHHVDSIVRVKRGSYSDLIHPLEMDARGILVPHVMNAADAREIVCRTRFHPIGRRPLDGGNADGGYTTVPLEQYMHHANYERMVIVQIEDPEPMSELDAIAGIDGIDMLFFGPGDFSHGIGAPGVWEDPRLIEARREVARAARAAGKFAGTVGSAQSLPRLIELGYQFISIGADVVGLSTYFHEIAQAFGRHDAGPADSIYAEPGRSHGRS